MPIDPKRVFMNRKILVIDKDPKITTMVKSCIRQVDKQDRIKILCAENGEVGLDKIDRNHPNLVILDMELPDMSAFDVLDKIRSNPDPRIERIPVLLLTRQRDAGTVVKALKKGVRNVLVKPFHWSDLLDRTLNLL